ncbi:MAG: glycosyltransferase [Thermoleophilia bacterium]|nr:glycosyltransferase [Thermoleophilia bacterium]
MNTQIETVERSDGLVGGLPRYGMAARFVVANLGALLFAAAGCLLASRWIGDLDDLITLPGAIVLVAFIAIIPGYLNVFLLLSLLSYRQTELDLNGALPGVSVLIAAYNEEDTLPETFRSLAEQDYPGEVEVIVVDDGSSDDTLKYLRSLRKPCLEVISAPHQGKAMALNAGLEAVSHRVLVTIDADTFLHPQALRRIVARLMQSPDAAAVAGTVLAKNSRASHFTRMQEWDYFLGIGAVKRQQSMYRGTLVAQGAFSAFRTGVVRSARGWPDRIGEDIVLTWALLGEGHQIVHEPTAIAFTRVPETFRGFYRQRQRWARGMIEALKSHLGIVWRRRRFASFFVALDLLFPPLDLVFSLVFLPGIVLACFGYFYIAGLMTLLVLPLTAFIVLIMLRFQRGVFDLMGLRIRRNALGFLAYFLIYQFIVSPICVVGYTRELLNLEKRW